MLLKYLIGCLMSLIIYVNSIYNFINNVKTNVIVFSCCVKDFG